MANVKAPVSNRSAELLVCDCEGTMVLDGAKLAENLGLEGSLDVHTQLCRRQLSAFDEAMDHDAPLLVGCTQEAPLFRELAEEKGRDGISFVNIRERAGWCKAGSSEAKNVQAKMAALLADAMHEPTPTGSFTINSDGQCLVYGAGQLTLDVALQLSDRLNVTVILVDASDVIPPSTVNVPLHIGHIRQLSGALGNFSVSIDGFAPALPSSMQSLGFEPPRNGFSTTCDLILDLSGGPSLVSASGGRDGYVKVDPNAPAAVAKAMFEISELVGEFEKPLYVDYDGDICAHGRSQKIGCRNCLDNCPTGAITSNGDIVAIDAAVCGGCGSCSAVCPTGAVSYSYPERHDVIQRVQSLARTFLSSGGERPVLILHDEQHGGEVIAMMARCGRGLPANAIPLSLYSVFQTGHETLAAGLASGFARVALLAPPDKPHDMPALESQAQLANTIAEAIGYGGDRIVVIAENDPDAIERQLHDLQADQAISAKPFSALGGKRQIARVALTALNDAAPEPRDIIPLPDGAPYGQLRIDAENCTLCLACVGACPASALNDDEERPRLTFNEASCVQCGLCVATCPEKVITLEPRYNFSASVLDPVLIKEEEPFECITCGRPFGTKSTVERIISKLEGRHAMFQNSTQIDIIKMCDDCRVVAVTDGGGDPLTIGERPRVRTTEDYLSGNVDDNDD